ncbi:MAG: class I SAM-dependent methyltransferase [Deltaproteobacteria bacterium]|nr:class I SAM-dependent methyltransferase [Nannocystaceae bacterium]
MLPLLGDAHACALVERLDHDFSRFEDRPRFASVARTLVFDEIVRAFLRAHPTGTVVELGAGLNTRFERLDNGQQRWFDIDLPEVTTLRRALLPSSTRRLHVSASVVERSWLELVATAPAPCCFVFEAMLGYVPCDQIRSMLARIARRFPGATIALDVHPRWAVVGGELVKSVAPIGLFGPDIPHTIERWQIGLELVETTRFLGSTFRTPGPLVLSATRAVDARPAYVVAQFRAGTEREALPDHAEQRDARTRSMTDVGTCSRHAVQLRRDS